MISKPSGVIIEIYPCDHVLEMLQLEDTRAALDL